MKDKPDLKKGEEIIKNLLEWLGLDTNSDSLKMTPKRVAQYFLDSFNGLYNEKPKITTFDLYEKPDYVSVTNIPIVSWCEHHLLPFVGKCGIVYYTKNKKIIGLSKLVRIVKYYASRPQTQENLTVQIANEIMNMSELKVEGVYVIISAQHTCMTIRGINAIGSYTNTASIRGNIDKNEAIHLLSINNFFKNSGDIL